MAKLLAGIALALGIGAAARLAGLPAPAPPALVGALVVVAMTLGYVLADRWLARRPATTRRQCGGPTGATRGDDAR